MTNWTKAVMAVSWLCLAAFEVTAEPKVLFDSGETKALSPFLEPLIPKKQAEAALPPRPPLDSRSYGLPVQTPSMTPGRVQPRRLPALHGKMGGARPLFLVGADRWSLQWLRKNKDRLVALQAVGMIIAARHPDDVSILRRAADPLSLIVASGEAIATTVDLRHYPVLIAPPGLMAQ